jgi:glycosyltransferase involved in cell wall biosynthesis
MITVSACLIVKNEERVLARCLDCIKQIADEIIIVDTGSTDKTVEIAKQYTTKLYDFTWVDDFSKARNFSFSKATMEYIYVADADEVIESDEIQNFLKLKEQLSHEVEIVQMYYANQLEFNTTYNFDKEYRPKLYKRLREFIWLDPLHEAVRLDPVIYDSEIVITHKPLGNHAGRDFEIFQRAIQRGVVLSNKLIGMYARELWIAGEKSDFIAAYPYFSLLLDELLEESLYRQCQCVVARAARYREDTDTFFQVCLKNVAIDHSSAEVCYELGEYYFEKGNLKEATIWYYNAAFETEAELNLHYHGDYPRQKLSECYQKLNNIEEAESYRQLAVTWLEENLGGNSRHDG